METESELIRYLKEKEERDKKERKKESDLKLGLICAGLILAPSLLPKGEDEW